MDSVIEKPCVSKTYILMWGLMPCKGSGNFFFQDHYHFYPWICTVSLPLFIQTDLYQKKSKRVWNFMSSTLTLIVLMWSIGWAPNNARKWQMGFNSAFKGLNTCNILSECYAEKEVYSTVHHIFSTWTRWLRCSEYGISELCALDWHWKKYHGVYLLLDHNFYAIDK